MHSERMRARVASARLRGVARLPGLRLAFDKLGRDGSAKANLALAPGAEVWGVVWCFPRAEWAGLDRFEGGYRRIEVEVVLVDGPLRVETYVSELLTRDTLPRPSYLRWIRAGAREHGLPAAYLAELDRLAAADPQCGSRS